jgi:arsenate reductase (thioredoxin)
MNNKPYFVFVCEHGAAKSIIAAAYFNKLASEKYLNMRAIARGTNPDAKLSPKTIAGLNKDGLTPTESIPQKLSLAEVESAQQIVSFCEMPEEYRNRNTVEQWDDVPPISANYEIARDVILEKLHHLLK